MLQTSPPVAQSRATRLTTALVAIVAVFAPLVLLAFNRDWFISPEGWLDPWHYVAFFHSYWDPDFGSGAYKLARLPWILSGVLAWTFLPPLPAAYALHAVYLCATTLAMFICVYRLFRQAALAALVTLCLGFYTHAHGSGGWDYHNTAAGAFYLASFAALASGGAIAGRRRSLALAGALLALTIHSNITLVNFLPVLVLVHLYLARDAGWQFSTRDLMVRAGWAVGGALAITAALALVHWSAGRGFLFFQDLMRVVVRFVGDSSNQAPYQLATDWYYTSAHLALPLAVFATGTIALIWTRGTPDPAAQLARVLILQFLCMALVWTGWQIAGQTALDWSYFAYALVPSCFIALAGLLKLAWREQYERPALVIAIVTAAALTLTLTGAAESLVSPLATQFGRAVTLSAGLVFIVALAAAFLRPAAVALSAFVVVFALANRIAAPAAIDYALSDPCKTRPEIYEAIVDASLWIGSIDPTYSQVRTWFDERERIALGPQGCSVSVRDVGESVTSMALASSIVEPGAVDVVPFTKVQEAANDNAIVTVLTASTETSARWDDGLRELGLARRELARHRVPLQGTNLTMHAWSIEQAPLQDVVFNVPLMTIDNGRRDVIIPLARVTHPPAVMPANENGTWARVRIETPGEISWCRVVLEDENAGALMSTTCNSGTRYVLLPALTRTVTLTVENPSNRPAPRPARIEVTLAQSAPGR